MQRRWTRAAAVAIVLVSIAGCSSDGPSAADSSSSPSATVVIRTDGGSEPGATAPAVDSSSRDTTSSGDTPSSSDDGVTHPSLPTPGAPGSFAARYLRPGESSRITVAALVQAGAAPQPGTLAHLQGVLQQVSGKPVEIVTTAVADGARSWTSSQLAAMADGNAPSPTADIAVLSLLFVHGDFEGDTSILGVSTRGDVAAVFVDQLAGSGGLLGTVAPIERAVSTHEVGHLLGLVDLVLHTGRQDPDHPGHSTNTGSVMYWAVESDLVGQLLGANPPTEFDAADLADLATIRAS